VLCAKNVFVEYIVNSVATYGLCLLTLFVKRGPLVLVFLTFKKNLVKSYHFVSILAMPMYTIIWYLSFTAS
jgi:hypothetical protein